MLERRENLTLAPEALDEDIRICREAHDLDGDLLLEQRVCSLREKDVAHATAADFAKDAIGADAAAHPDALQHR